MSHEPPRRKPAAVRPANDQRDSFEPSELEPAQPLARWNGWTVERQANFIQALADTE